jgi:hypothetical protein
MLGSYFEVFLRSLNPANAAGISPKRANDSAPVAGVAVTFGAGYTG